MIKLFGLAFIIGLFSAPATAGVLNSSPTQIPFLYRYGSCVFAPHPDGPEAAIRGCQELKKILTIQGEEAINLFERGAALQRKRQLSLAFRRIEKEALRAVNEYKTVPIPIVDYLGCLGGKVIADENFKAGVSIEYIAFEEECRAEYYDEAVSKLPETQKKRANKLYHRFRYTERVMASPDGFGDSKWQDGLLGLRYLPDDKNIPES